MLETLLPTGTTPEFYPCQYPTEDGGTFFMNELYGLPTLEDIESFDPSDSSSNPTYMRYMLLPKVLTDTSGACELEHIYEALKSERMPQYVVAAG